MMGFLLNAEHPSNRLCWEWGSGEACPGRTPLMLSPPPCLLPTGQAAVSDGTRTVLLQKKAFQRIQLLPGFMASFLGG